jgi:hypothetical protein
VDPEGVKSTNHDQAYQWTRGSHIQNGRAAFRFIHALGRVRARRRRHTRARPPATTLDRDVTHGVFVPRDAVSMTFASAMHAKLENERARSVATAACAACTVGFLFMRQRAIRGAIAKMLTVRGDSALCVVLVLVRARGMGSRTRERGR